jgi:hypothetical protein
MPLLNLTVPKLSTKEHSAYMSAIGAFMDPRWARWQDWRTVVWTLDERPVEARVFAWAGAWTGFVVTRSELVTAVGVEVPPERLSLSTWADTGNYQFDVTQPIVVPDTLRAALASAPGTRGRRAWPAHPDHRELLPSLDL